MDAVRPSDEPAVAARAPRRRCRRFQGATGHALIRETVWLAGSRRSLTAQSLRRRPGTAAGLAGSGIRGVATGALDRPIEMVVRSEGGLVALMGGGAHLMVVQVGGVARGVDPGNVGVLF